MLENKFAHHIDKETIQTLPLTAFSGKVFVIEKEEQVQSAYDYLINQPVIGVDTEARPSFEKDVHYETSLIQMATLDTCFLFRLNKIGLHPLIIAIFNSPNVKKVGLAFKNDFIGLRRGYKPTVALTPKACVDIQSMVNDYGILDLSLQKITAIMFGEKISKAQQLSNWEDKTLTEAQISYAATDAWITLRIYNRLLETEPLYPDEVAKLKAEDK